MNFTAYSDVLAHLDGLGLFHMDFALHRMEKALRNLNLSPTPPFVCVQVVGTNGKGSTASFLASLARAHGLNVGLYTSPHFVTPRERIRINGRMLAEEAWPELGNRVMQANPELTYFEFLTVLAMLAFRDAGADLVVMEAGLGGHYDATTAMPCHGVCFVPIDLDHQKILGDTVTAIAADKAQAMRPGQPAWTAPQSAEALAVLRRRAAELKIPLVETDRMRLPKSKLGLAGPHQASNARTALAVWNSIAARFGWETRQECVLAGLRDTVLPGRFQSIFNLFESRGLPPVIVDGGHNPHGLRSLLSAVHKANILPSAVIFSCLADKAVDEMVGLVHVLAKNRVGPDSFVDIPLFLPTIQDNERAISGEELARRFGERNAPTRAVPTLADALASLSGLETPPSREHPAVICGSLYLLGEFFTMYPEAMQEAAPERGTD